MSALGQIFSISITVFSYVQNRNNIIYFVTFVGEVMIMFVKICRSYGIKLVIFSMKHYLLIIYFLGALVSDSH